MLLLLGVQTANRPGISAMKETVIDAMDFGKETYCKGTDIVSESAGIVFFEECFNKWKAQITLPEKTCAQWLEKIDRWLKLRVSAIMDANRRNYYGECAAFIAALGEVLESRGESGEKQRIMQWYRMEYSRRRAFHEELRRYGMKK